MGAEIYLDERTGDEMLRCKCVNRPGDRHLDPKKIWVSATTGEARLLGETARLQVLDFEETKTMVKHWLAQRGQVEPQLERA